MMWMTEKTIQKAVFPLPKTCREARRSEGAVLSCLHPY